LPDPKTPVASETRRSGARDAARVAKITAAVIAVIAAAVGLWYARTAILLAFAGILLAIVFYGASKALAELTKLPRLLMRAVVVLSTAIFFLLVFSTAGPTLTQQIAQLARSLAIGATSLTKELASFADQSSIHQNIDLVEILGKFLSPWGIATGATSVALSIVGLFSASLIVLFFGIYFAADPDTYVDIVARLSPPERRAAILEVMYETGNRLRRWLIGQGISMATIGTSSFSACQSPSCSRCSPDSPASCLISGRSSARSPWFWSRAARASISRCGWSDSTSSSSSSRAIS
jgi:predicted PurR-regulated permease PerM